MFANGKNVETRCVSKLCCGKDFRQALLSANCGASLRVWREISEGIKPQLERIAHLIVVPFNYYVMMIFAGRIVRL